MIGVVGKSITDFPLHLPSELLSQYLISLPRDLRVLRFDNKIYKDKKNWAKHYRNTIYEYNRQH
jgi:hypothetical protein